MESNNEKNIVYESHFHVALTRAKNKIYFGLQYNNDDIHFYNKETKKWSRPEKRIVKYLKKGKSEWFEIGDWDLE